MKKIGRKKIGRKNIRHIIAEKVMGWTYLKTATGFKWVSPDGLNHVNHLPLKPDKNLNHANDAVEKWLQDGNKREYHHFTHDKRPIVHDVTLYDGILDTGKIGDQCDVGVAENKSKGVAVCLALVQAVTGEKYELKEK